MFAGRYGHLLLLHATEDERRSGFANWVRHGFDRRERVVSVEPEDAGVSPALLAALSWHGINGDAASAARSLVGMPLDTFGTPEGRAEVVEAALADGYSGIRLIIDATSLLTASRTGQYGDIDRDIDQLCRAHPVSAMCHYDQSNGAETALDEVTAPHVDGAIRERQLRLAGGKSRLTLSGEVDITNQGMLASALRAVTSGSPATIRLDLQSVTFLSVGGARALASGTQAYRDRGGRIELFGPHPGVERVLRMLGLDELAGMALVVAGRLRRRWLS